MKEEILEPSSSQVLYNMILGILTVLQDFPISTYAQILRVIYSTHYVSYNTYIITHI